MASRDEMCAYCNERSATTRDHVISRALFDVVPEDIFTVPACRPCNLEKSKDESYLRDYLSVEIHNHEHPVARTLFQGKVKRSIAKNRSELAREARVGFARVPASTQSGLYLGELTIIPIDNLRVSRVVALMGQGLLYHYGGLRLPENFIAEAGLIEPDKRLETIRYVASRTHHGPHTLGGTVFQCIYLQATDTPASTLWLLQFYAGTLFLVNTLPAENT